MATLWGAQIVTSRSSPSGPCTCAAAEHFGIPVRTELTVLSADDPKSADHRLLGVREPRHRGYNPVAPPLTITADDGGRCYRRT